MDAKTSYNVISYETELNIKTIWIIIKTVSSILVPNYYKNAYKICEQDIIVKIDEFDFLKKYSKSHKAKRICMFGIVEKTDQRRI